MNMEVPDQALAPPRRLAWIGRHARPPEPNLWRFERFADSDDFLLSPAPYDFDLYVLELRQRGVGALDLIRLLRRRSGAAMLALSDAQGTGLVAALDAGADMVLPGDSAAEHLRAGIAALLRRTAPPLPAASGTTAPAAWRLHPAQAALLCPDGQRVKLSEADLALIRCFAEAPQGRVSRQALCERLWGDAGSERDNALHATLYRLRKRVEQAGAPLLPIRALARTGYEFRAPLIMDEA